MNEMLFAEKVKGLGGRAYIVGGYVRDKLCGRMAKDKDYVIAGISEAAFCEQFPEASRVGKSFPVYLLNIDHHHREVALARKERKCGSGYKGFSVEYSSAVTIEEDLYRRDTTMNSIAVSLDDERMIDPYGGADDIRRGIIRATSPHFLEDPVRALRAARQAAQMGFEIEAGTLSMMKKCGEELQFEPKERIVGELSKALAAERPAEFFRTLLAAELLEDIFPELFALIGKTQPVLYHPEGDAFIHTMSVLSKAAALTDRIEVRFAALVHDIGKGMTKKEDLPHHYGHENSGVVALRSLDTRLCLPKLWLTCAEFAIKEHMRVNVMKKPAKIVDFLLTLEKSPLGIDGFSAVVEADNGKVPEMLKNASQALISIHQIKGMDAPLRLRGRQIGEWIRQKQIEAYIALTK